ncbi:MAG: TfoX/Sxy family protein [Alphaproteobacteria bacterium]
MAKIARTPGARFVADLVGALTPLGPVTARAMFGGWGIYLDGLCFALVAGATPFFKVDDRNRPDFERAGMTPFKPWDDRPIMLLTYYEVPRAVVDDASELRIWAGKSIEAARRAKSTKTRKRRAQKR